MANVPALPITEPQWPTAAAGYGAEAAAIASLKWHELVGVLAGRGVVLSEVATALELYAITYARMVLAERHIAEHGAIVKAPRTGVPQHNPNLTISNACQARLMKLDKQLGLVAAAGDGPKPARKGNGLRL